MTAYLNMLNRKQVPVVPVVFAKSKPCCYIIPGSSGKEKEEQLQLRLLNMGKGTTHHQKLFMNLPHNFDTRLHVKTFLSSNPTPKQENNRKSKTRIHLKIYHTLSNSTN